MVRSVLSVFLACFLSWGFAGESPGRPQAPGMRAPEGRVDPSGRPRARVEYRDELIVESYPNLRQGQHTIHWRAIRVILMNGVPVSEIPVPVGPIVSITTCTPVAPAGEEPDDRGVSPIEERQIRVEMGPASEGVFIFEAHPNMLYRNITSARFPNGVTRHFRDIWVS